MKLIITILIWSMIGNVGGAEKFPYLLSNKELKSLNQTMDIVVGGCISGKFLMPRKLTAKGIKPKDMPSRRRCDICLDAIRYISGGVVTANVMLFNEKNKNVKIPFDIFLAYTKLQELLAKLKKIRRSSCSAI